MFFTHTKRTRHYVGKSEPAFKHHNLKTQKNLHVSYTRVPWRVRERSASHSDTSAPEQQILCAPSVKAGRSADENIP